MTVLMCSFTCQVLLRALPVPGSAEEMQALNDVQDFVACWFACAHKSLQAEG